MHIAYLAVQKLLRFMFPASYIVFLRVHVTITIEGGSVTIYLRGSDEGGHPHPSDVFRLEQRGCGYAGDFSHPVFIVHVTFFSQWKRRRKLFTHTNRVVLL